MDSRFSVTIDAMEADLIEAIRTVFARYRAVSRALAGDPGTTVVITTSTPGATVFHHWPDRSEPTQYDQVVRHQVLWEGGRYELLTGLEHNGRFAYGRNRARIVVFQVTGSGLYPLVEFARTDEPQPTFASVIPRPGAIGRKQASVDDLDRVRAIPYLANADVRHVGDVFQDKAAGTTLRLVCNQEDTLTMVTHALHVGKHRDKLQ